MKNNAVVIADSDGVIRFWSPGAEAAFGHLASDAVGQTLALIVPEEYREAHWRGFRRAIEAGSAAAEGEPGPFPVLLADGEIVAFPGRLSLVREPAGGVVGALVVFGPTIAEVVGG